MRFKWVPRLIKMEMFKIVFIIASLSFSIPLHKYLSHFFFESEIKKVAYQVNRQIKCGDLAKCIKAKGSNSPDRFLFNQFAASGYCGVPYRLKENIISEFEWEDIVKTSFSNNIDAGFSYHKRNSLAIKASIYSNESAAFDLKLGEYLSIKDHPKAKGVNLKLRVPIGWEVKEGDRPNIVKKFTNNQITYLILIKDNVTFFSRKQIRESFQENNFVEEFVHGSYLKDPQLIEKQISTVDFYPSFVFKYKGDAELSGLTLPLIMKCWVVFYEDKIVYFQGFGMDDHEFTVLEQLYSMITNSVIFPEQYY